MSDVSNDQALEAVLSAMRQRGNGRHSHPTTRKVELLTLAQIASIPMPHYLVDDYIVAGGITSLSGKFSTYKSFIAMHWACKVAAQGGSAVYVINESAYLVKSRFTAWSTYHGVDYGLLEQGVRFDTGNLKLVPEDEEATIAAIGKADLIVYDTLRRATAGYEEGSNDDWAVVTEVADRIRKATESTILLVDHEGHETAGRPRGASSKLDSVDIAINVKRETMDTPWVTMSLAKPPKFGPGWAPRKWNAVPSGYGDEIVLVQTDEKVFGKKAANARELHLALWEAIGKNSANEFSAAKAAGAGYWNVAEDVARRRINRGVELGHYVEVRPAIKGKLPAFYICTDPHHKFLRASELASEGDAAE